MKCNAVFFSFLFSFILFMSGCGRIIDWGKTQVEQGTELETNLKTAQNNIRSSRTYDQFTLIGAFDSLWLNDDVRDVYAELYKIKHGRTEQEKKVFLRRQLEENNHFISFYLLGATDIEIGEKDSDWTILLQIGDYNFVPTEFKTVELAPEYKAIFGKHFTRFKTAYILQFNAKDIDDNSLITPETKEVSLLFRTVKKQVLHTWHVDKEREVIA